MSTTTTTMNIAVLALCALTMANAKISESVRRRLSYAQIAGYSPNSQVTDHCAIDLDQAAMEGYLAQSTNDAFTTARLIYSQGGNSESYAHITLGGPLTHAVPKSTRIVGVSDNGSQLVGKAYEYAPFGSTAIKIQYQTSDTQSDNGACAVGGLPKEQQNTAGCLTASGSISIETHSYGSVAFEANYYDYTYDPVTDNNNGRTIADFSKMASEEMRLSCDGCPYTDHKYFYDYYGVDDYGDRWVTAAFTGGKTQFSRGNADFGLYGFSGKSDAIKKGTVYFNIFHYVIRELESALDNCERGCTDDSCNRDAIHAWGEGVCFYTGSIEGETGATSSGLLLHQLADKRCVNFRTCGANGDQVTGKSKLNILLLQLYKIGQFQLQSKKCGQARETVREITKLLYIPFIQGALRYAYRIDLGGDVQATEAARAKGAVFAAAVLPRIFAADKSAAGTVYENLKTGAPDTDFAAVKKAFESVYPQLGITCDDIGGIWNQVLGAYYRGAEPCVDGAVPIKEESDDEQLLIVMLGSTLGGLFFIAVVGLCLMKRRSTESADANKPGSLSTGGVVGLTINEDSFS